MLRSLKSLERYRVTATDGEIGTVVDFLLDDERWAVRYLVVETGGLLSEHRVLITPISLREADWSTQRFYVALTIDKVKNSPSVDLDKPVSRQHERAYHRYYGYPLYWGLPGSWGVGGYPGLLAVPAEPTPAEAREEKPGDAHLRSAREVRGYRIQGTDDAIGHIDDFLVDDQTWEVQYLAIDTSNWWLGKKVLVPPRWASGVSWEEKKVHVEMTRESIKNSPEWNTLPDVNRDFETRLFHYYGRKGYWPTDPAPLVTRPVEEPKKGTP